MKLNKVAVFSRNMKKSIDFYKLIGFEFPSLKKNTTHIESIQKENGATLMIDSFEIINDLIGEEPYTSNSSIFAIEYTTKKEIDTIVENLTNQNFKVKKKPWEAFWGQYYCTIQDPFRHNIDLFVNLLND